MVVYKQLEKILNRALPKKSNIFLKVCAIASEKGYSVSIIKNGKQLESFHINIPAALRMVENINV